MYKTRLEVLNAILTCLGVSTGGRTELIAWQKLNNTGVLVIPPNAITSEDGNEYLKSEDGLNYLISESI